MIGLSMPMVIALVNGLLPHEHLGQLGDVEGPADLAEQPVQPGELALVDPDHPSRGRAAGRPAR